MSAQRPDYEREVGLGLQNQPSDEEIFDLFTVFANGQELNLLGMPLDSRTLGVMFRASPQYDGFNRQGKSRLSQTYYDYLLGVSDRDDPPYGLTEDDFEFFSPIPPSPRILNEIMEERIPNEDVYRVYGMFLWIKQINEAEEQRQRLADEVIVYAETFAPQKVEFSREEMLQWINRAPPKKELISYGIQDLFRLYMSFLRGERYEDTPPFGLTTADFGSMGNSYNINMAQKLLAERVAIDYMFYMHGLFSWIQARTKTGDFKKTPIESVRKQGSSDDSGDAPPTKRQRTGEAQIRAALKRAGGNVAQAAALLERMQL